MSNSSINQASKPVVTSLAELKALVNGGTLQSGDEISFNGNDATLFFGTTTPGISQIAYIKGDMYGKLSSNKLTNLYVCTGISVANDVYSYEWTEIATKSGGSTLDATLIPGKQYILADQAATFNMVLPASGGYQDAIEVIFKATAAFTPTTSEGTVVGDTIPATVANKTYDLMFTWVGSAWLLQYLAW